VNYSLVENPTDGFNQFVMMHEMQWKAVNKLGHFDDWPYARKFHEDLVKSHSQLNRLRLFCLSANNKPIAYRYIYCFGKRYYSFLPARIRGEGWDKLGLGQIAHTLTVEKAIEESVFEIDAGRGHYDHKLKLGGVEYPVISFIAGKNNLGSIIRIRLFCFFSRLINLLYYRIWFNRIAPKLPLKRRPLWKLWIRTRL
jgi:CelD/BcsL family acetyltransferase involved in cellulose biosynthesis